MGQFRKAAVWGCIGWLASCPYFDLRSNAIPLAFGMTPEDVAVALNAPLEPVSGRRGSQVYYAKLPWNPSAPVYDRELWLQFRNNRLTGWKNDWKRPQR